MTGETPRRRASLELLRAEAADERSVLVHERLRAGEDPWVFMEQLPTVDEIVVLLLRAELLGTRQRPSAHASDAALRAIAMEHPQLATTVWRLLSVATASGPWHPRVRRESA